MQEYKKGRCNLLHLLISSIKGTSDCQAKFRHSYYSLVVLSAKTELRIRIMPHTELASRGSAKSITLNSVAAIGSTIPRAVAVPAGNVFNARVYRK